MPKFKRPKKAVGLNLRAVIEGELMKLPRFGFDYAVVEDIATIIEKRIQDGPSDWLSLSDGTTFEKSWVPEAGDPIYFLKSTVPDVPINEDWELSRRRTRDYPPLGPPKFADPKPVMVNTEEEHNFIPVQEDKLGALGHDSNRLLVKSLHNISNEHEKRVAAHKLEHEIQAHEDWLESERGAK